MTKAIRINPTTGRILEVYPWSKAELKENKLYHASLVKQLRDCPEPVEENWFWYGHRAYRYAPSNHTLTGKRIWARMRKYAMETEKTFQVVAVNEDKTKHHANNIELREALADAGFDPDVILAKETAVEKTKGFFGI